MKPGILLTIVASALAVAGTLRAEQGGSGHYVSGSTASFIDSVPGKPGFGIQETFFYYNNAGANASRELPLGGTLAQNADASVYADSAMVLYQAPLAILGGNPVFGISIPYVWMNIRARAVITTSEGSGSSSGSDTDSGIGDIQLWPVWLGWTNGDFKYDVRFSVYAPTGRYDQNDLANVGLGYWTFEPELSFSWISSKIGTEFSVFAGLDFNTKNTDADYQSGDIFHVDVTVSQYVALLGGFAGVGANGFYYKQFTGDTGSGAELGAFETEYYGVGPVGSYARKIGKSDLVFEVKWLPQMHVENTFKGNFIWAKLLLLF